MFKPYQPTAEQPWNVRRVVHLHRRAGLAAKMTGKEDERVILRGNGDRVAIVGTGKNNVPLHLFHAALVIDPGKDKSLQITFRPDPSK